MMMMILCLQDGDKARRFEYLLKQTTLYDSFLKDSKHLAQSAAAKATTMAPPSKVKYVLPVDAYFPGYNICVMAHANT